MSGSPPIPAPMPPQPMGHSPMSPPALDRVISTCLAKDPKERWHTAHDVRLQLAWIAEGGSQIGLPAPIVQHRKNRERMAWIAAAVATVWFTAKVFRIGLLMHGKPPNFATLIRWARAA